MFMHQDWLMRQIETMIAAIAQLLLGKGSKGYELREEADQERSAELKRKLTDLLHEGRLGDAENLLFFSLDEADGAPDQAILAAAIDFYQQANSLSDQELEAQGFTRSELLDGLNEIVERYGLFAPGLWGNP